MLGYCYLNIINVLHGQKRGLRQANFMAAVSLGPFPTLSNLLVYCIEAYPYAIFERFPALELVGEERLHAPTCSYYSTSVFELANDFRGWLSFRVGSREVNVPLSRLFPQLDFDTAVTKMGEHIMNLESLQSIANTVMLTKYDEALTRARKDPKIVIPIHLSREDEKQLQSAFRHYNIVFESRDTAQHSYAAASRICENEDLLRMARYHNDIPIKTNYDVQVVDVGGNWMSHFSRGRKSVHSCCPVLDVNDDRRASYRITQLAQRMSITDTQKKILDYNIKNVSWQKTKFPLFCLRKGQDCNVRAPVCIFLHSIYDMKSQDIADCLDAHSSVVAHGTFIFSAKILSDFNQKMSGDIPILKCRWKRFFRKNVEMIRFSFIDDSSWNYCHVYEDYMNLIYNKKLISTRGNTYYVELKQNVNGIQFFTITRSVMPCMYESTQFHSVWLDNHKYVRLRYYEFDPRYNNSRRRKLIIKNITARAEIVSAIQAYALSVTDTKFSVSELFNYTRSYVNRVIINGQAITNRFDDYKDDIDYELLTLVQAIFISVYDKKYQAGLVVKEIMDRIKLERAEQNLISILFKKCSDYITEKCADVQSNVISILFGNFLANKYDLKIGLEDCEFTIEESMSASYSQPSSNLTVFDRIHESRDTISIYIDERELAKRLEGGGDANVTFGAVRCLCSDLELYEYDVPGDGDCQFSAIGMSLGKFSYRKYLIGKYKFDESRPSQLNTNNDQWGDEETLKYISANENINICVHIVGKNAEFEKFRHYVNPEATQTVHVLFDKNHYRALVDVNKIREAGPTIIEVDGQDPPLCVTIDNDMVEVFNQIKAHKVIDEFENLLKQYDISYTNSDLVTMHNNLLKLSAVIPKQSFTTACKEQVSKNFYKFKNLLQNLKYSVEEWQFNAYAKKLIIKQKYNPCTNKLNIKLIENEFAKNVLELNIVPSDDDLIHKCKVNYMCAFYNIGKDLATSARNESAEFAKRVVDDMKVQPKKKNKSKSKSTTKVVEVEVDARSTSSNSISLEEQYKAKNVNKATVQKMTVVGSQGSLQEKYLKVEKSSPRHSNTSNDVSDSNFQIASEKIIETSEKDDDTMSEHSTVSNLSTASSIMSNVSEVKKIRETIDLQEDDKYHRLKKKYQKPLPPNALNRSQAKLQEILNNFPLTCGTEKALDLCSAPGGFVVELSNVFTEVSCCFYKNSKLKNFPALKRLKNIKYLEYDRNDLTDDDTICYYTKLKGFDLVTADGCLESNIGNRELNNLPLITAECMIATSVLNNEGTFIVKVFDMFLSETREIIAITAVNFSDFRVYRCAYSTEISSEYYVIFTNKLSLPKLHNIKKVKNILRGYIRKNNNTLLGTLKEFERELQSTNLNESIDTLVAEDTDSIEVEDNQVDVVGNKLLTNKLPFEKTGIDMTFYDLGEKIDRLSLCELQGKDSLESYWMGNAYYRSLWRMPDCSYEVPDNPIRYMRNAIKERIDLWRINEAIIGLAYEEFYNKYLIGQPHKAILSRVCLAHSENFGVIDGKTGAFIVRPKDLCGKYEKAFTNGRFINLYYSEDNYEQIIPDSKSGLLLVGNNSRLMQDPKLYNRVKNIDVNKVPLRKISLVSGVPGCGKTFYILQNANKEDLVVTTTKENCEDIKTRNRELVDCVKTLHSVILHGYKNAVNTMYVDEALMAHIGEIMIVAELVKCKRVVLIGDEKQIPFISRNKLFEAKYYSCNNFCYEKAYMNMSHRVPLDVATYYSKQYEKGFKTSNKLTDTVKIIKVSNPTQIKNTNNIILVFKQAEKASLKILGFSNVNTVHEFQGKQSTHIIIYRDSIYNSDMIYESDPHILVALTRHTKSLIYYTRKEDDKICRIIRAIQQQTYGTLAGGATESLDLYLRRNTNYTGPMYEHEVSRGLAVDLPRLEMAKTMFDLPTLKKYRLKFKTGNFNINCVQTWYDEILRGNSSFDTSNDIKILQNDDLKIELTGKLSLDIGKLCPKPQKYDRLRPKLRTAVGCERPRSQRETLLAYQKRNNNVPQLSETNSLAVVMDLLLEKFMVYIDNDKIDLFNSFRHEQISLNSESIDLWLRGQSNKNVAFNDEFLCDINLTLYDFMIKTKPKVDATEEAPFNYAALQTIAYHSQAINQLLCPVFRDLKERLLTVLDKRFLIFSDLSSAEFAEEMNKYHPDGLQNCNVYEIDISKYDKSQGELALELDCAIMRMFGVKEEIILLWRNSHTVTSLVDRRCGVKAEVVYQRKSGDAFTFGGNTLHLMSVLALAVDMSKVRGAVFAGDDSGIFMDGTLTLDTIDVFQNVFNLEAKLFKRQYLYFCSKFLVYDELWFFVPDLVKLVSKLGRKDLRNFDHAEEYRVSLKDLLMDLNNKKVMQVLNEAINERYPSNIQDHTILVSNLMKLVSCRENFSELFYSEKGDKLCMDKKLPSLSW
nr:hypothetical protein [Leuven Virga-like virus 1]